jgi:hypothetical protein
MLSYNIGKGALCLKDKLKKKSLEHEFNYIQMMFLEHVRCFLPEEIAFNVK